PAHILELPVIPTRLSSDLPPSWCTCETADSMITLEPCASTSSRQRSHIIPGPYFGYWNSSMRLVMSFWLRLGSTALSTAFDSDRDRKSTRLNSSHVKISYA